MIWCRRFHSIGNEGGRKASSADNKRRSTSPECDLEAADWKKVKSESASLRVCGPDMGAVEALIMLSLLGA